MGFQNILALFNKGTINQNEIVSVLTRIDTLVDSISRTFHEGKISQALSDIKSAFKDHERDPEGKFNLLLLEAKFFIHLRKFDHFEERVNFLEESYGEYIDNNFLQLKLSLLSLKKEKKEFHKTLRILKQESGNNIMPDEYFEILYFLNSGDINKAKEEFQKKPLSSYKESEQKNLLYLGASIYRSIYLDTMQEEDYERAKDLYAKYIDSTPKSNLPFLDKLQSATHLNSITIIHPFRKIISEEEKTNNQLVIELIEPILSDLRHFNTKYKNDLLSRYVACLYLQKEYTKAQTVYDEQDGDENLNDLCFYFRHFNKATNETILHSTIQERILAEKSIEPFLGQRYLISFPNKAFAFLNENLELLLNDTELLQLYLLYVHDKQETPLQKVLDHVISHKNTSNQHYLLFLYSQQIKNKKLSKGELNEFQKVVESSDDSNIIFLSLRLLAENNLFKIYMRLAYEHRSKQGIVSTVLDLAQKDKNFSLAIFDSFIEGLEKLPSPIQVAEIYADHKQLTKAYKLLKAEWHNEKISLSSKVDIAIFSISDLSLQYLGLTEQRNKIDSQQDKIYCTFLEEQINTLDIHTILTLGLYLLATNTAPDQAIHYVNSVLLVTPKNEIDDDAKPLLRSIWGQFLLHFDDKVPIELPSNVYLSKGGINYLKENQYENLLPERKFSVISEHQYDIAFFDPSYKKQSLFHRLINETFKGTFLSGPEFQIIKGDSIEEKLSEIIKLSEERKKHIQNLLELHMEGELVGFNQICNGDYGNYFGLIPDLINDQDKHFPSNQCRQLPDTAKKILTLSSIVFLNHFKKLDVVLARSDTFIQKTTLDWIHGELGKLKLKKKKGTIITEEGTLYYDKLTKKKRKSFNKFLTSLATKLTSNTDFIIDDREEIILNANSLDLVETMGFQEYKALACALNRQYQIISEDHIFDGLIKVTNSNPYLVGNSLSVLNQIDLNELVKLWKKLQGNNYKYLFDKASFGNFINKLVLNWPYPPERIRDIDTIRFFIKVGHEYSWLDPLENYYRNNYQFIAPMKFPPKKDYISDKIEMIFQLVKS